MIDLAQLLNAKGRGRWKTVTCPVCGNKRAGITEGDRGWVFNCFEGCTFQEMCDTLGLSGQDLFWDELEPRTKLGFDKEVESYILAQAVCAKRRGEPLQNGDRERAMMAMKRLKSAGLYEETMRKLG